MVQFALLESTIVMMENRPAHHVQLDITRPQQHQQLVQAVLRGHTVARLVSQQ